MDKSWMSTRKFSREYMEGVKSFMRFVQDNMGSDCNIRCPCKYCMNAFMHPQQTVETHLNIRGIDTQYSRWIFHGESYPSDIGEDSAYNGATTVMDDGDVNDEDEQEDGVAELLSDFGDFIHQQTESINDVTGKRVGEFEQMLREAQKELYPGCSKYSKLAFVVKLLHLKVYNKWSNKSFDMLLNLLRDSFPASNLIPQSLYEAKNMLRSLGLGYELIHACKNDCALFWKEFEHYHNCPKCNTSRWKVNNGQGQKIPQKVLRYFPLKPRLQRLYMSMKTASEMRWHEEKRNKDGCLRHPADSKAWKDFDEEFPWFAEDCRNVRLGCASDGFNPFGNMSNAYSMWPVILMPYNLPPWMCMKEPFLMLSLLIPGPTAPGKDIHIYLQPLIDDLKELWTEGVQTYDSHTKSTFQLHAAILWTINDFPAYGNLSGWSTKGYMACPTCNHDTCAYKLRSKLSYMGHRRFLPNNHSWRKSQKFDGKSENRSAPRELSGDDVLNQLDQIPETQFGKHPSNKKRKRAPEELNWVARSAFFQLPYWSKLKLRHNLDVMHIEKNICDNVVGTLLNVNGKTKDTVKGRLDLEDMNIRKELHLVKRSDGSYEMPHACYTMTKEERKLFCEFLKSVKFPDGYASNIARCVNIDEGKLSGLKSHDCHVLLQRLLPVGVRGILDKRITDVLAELGEFFRQLCCTKLHVEVLEKLQVDIVHILCKLEMIFPPSFFDVMVHLAVHLPQEAIFGGPVQFRWMFRIERFLKTLKGFVGNRAYPEGSIAEAFVVKECLTFCSMYLHGIETHYNAQERNFDIEEDAELSVFSTKVRPIGASKHIDLSTAELNLAHWFVLSNCAELKEYIDEHLKLLEEDGPLHIDERHRNQFPSWFKNQMASLYASHDPKATEELYSISCGPQSCVKSYTGCIVNGVRFHTKDRDNRRKTQNSGIIVQGNHGDAEIDFYGRLLDIIQLDYLNDMRVYLFKCEWYDLGSRRYGSGLLQDGPITSIKVTSTWYENDPFVLANQVKQVFYINDPKLGPSWRVVQKFHHRYIYSQDLEALVNIDLNEVGTANDNVYQDEEPSNMDVRGQEENDIGFLHRDDAVSNVVDANILQESISRHAVNDDFIVDDDSEDDDILLDDDDEDSFNDFEGDSLNDVEDDSDDN